MTNTKVLQLIISELSNDGTIAWKGDKELFELLFAPIPYGTELNDRRTIAKKPIYDIFDYLKYEKDFDKTNFNKLANNIVCGENEHSHREEAIAFIQKEIIRLEITTDADIKKIIITIPCNDGKVKNYKTNFGNWKKKGTSSNITDKKVKNALQKNFDFEHDLWSMSDFLIKTTLEKNVENFIKEHTRGGPIDPLDGLINKLGARYKITEEELSNLLEITNMDSHKIKQYIQENHPLSKHKSQKFILKLVSSLYSKGFYELLLYDAIEYLDEDIKDSIEVKKIKAHAWGSSIIGEYKKAFDILRIIPSDDDREIVNMRTEALSNMRRYELNDAQTNNNQKKVILEELIFYYEEIFNLKDTYHYYPGINLAYISEIATALHNDIKQNISISSIYNKSKKSINIDKKSDDTINQYYANIATIEFMLLEGIGNPSAELERFLELEEQTIHLIELGRTKRQMQFFIDTIVSSGIANNPKVENMQKAIDIIDCFREHLASFET